MLSGTAKMKVRGTRATNARKAQGTVASWYHDEMLLIALRREAKGISMIGAVHALLT